MFKQARRLSDLETPELKARLVSYAALYGECLQALEYRGVHTSALRERATAARTAPVPAEPYTPAMDWLKFLVHEAFSPVHDDPALELDRLRQYLAAAGLLAAEGADDA